MCVFQRHFNLPKIQGTLWNICRQNVMQKYFLANAFTNTISNIPMHCYESSTYLNETLVFSVLFSLSTTTCRCSDFFERLSRSGITLSLESAGRSSVVIPNNERTRADLMSNTLSVYPISCKYLISKKINLIRIKEMDTTKLRSKTNNKKQKQPFFLLSIVLNQASKLDQHENIYTVLKIL